MWFITWLILFMRCQQGPIACSNCPSVFGQTLSQISNMQAWNLKLDGCLAKTYELGIWKWNPKRALPWSVLGSDNIKPWLSLTGMEKRVNYAISGQNLDIVTKTSDKNLLILTQVCITAELFWKLERICSSRNLYIPILLIYT